MGGDPKETDVSEALREAVGVPTVSLFSCRQHPRHATCRIVVPHTKQAGSIPGSWLEQFGRRGQ